MMNKVTLMLFCIVCSVAAFGQNALIKVQYTATSPKWMSKGKTASTKMLLLSGPESSRYFNSMSQLVDSMTSTPEGEKQLREIQFKAWFTQGPDGSITINKSNSKVPDKRVNLYVDKDFAYGIITVYDKYVMEAAVYTEPFDEMQWIIVEDSIKTILGYECILGQTDYHGRRWKAWFSPEIPVQDGPWKFHGLPGLILLAETDGAPFRFEATGIEATDQKIPPMYKTDTYTKTERKKALAEKDYGNNNREALLTARFGITAIVKNTGEKRAAPKFEKDKHSIETDY